MIRGWDQFLIQVREMDRIFDPNREYDGIKTLRGGALRRIMKASQQRDGETK